MGRPSFTLDDYKAVGDDKGLDFLGPLPTSILVRTNWRCRLTGIKITKSLAATRSQDFGSRYQRGFRAWYEKYKELAERLGIRFIYDPYVDYFPATTKHQSVWQGPSGQRVSTTYHDLAYGRIAQDLAADLGLIVMEPV